MGLAGMREDLVDAAPCHHVSAQEKRDARTRLTRHRSGFQQELHRQHERHTGCERREVNDIGSERCVRLDLGDEIGCSDIDEVARSER
jgi:hypothetical protein